MDTTFRERLCKEKTPRYAHIQDDVIVENIAKLYACIELLECEPEPESKLCVHMNIAL